VLGMCDGRVCSERPLTDAFAAPAAPEASMEGSAHVESSRAAQPACPADPWLQPAAAAAAAAAAAEEARQAEEIVCVRSLWLKGLELSFPPPWLLALLPPWLLAEMWFAVLFASAMACGYGLQLSWAAAAHKKAAAKKAMMKVKKALKRRKAKAKAKAVSNFLANHQVFDDDHTGLSMAEVREQVAEMQRNLERQEATCFDMGYDIALLFHHVPAAFEEETRMWAQDLRARQGDRVMLG